MHIALGRKVLLCLASSVFAACSLSAGTTGNAKNAGNTERSREITHEPCDVQSNGSERIDANGDGKPDVTIVSEGGKEQCRASDLDFDGRIDLFTYQDKDGKITRRELDFDRDGNIDEIQLFKNGELLEKHRSSTLARALDTWETYAQGRLVKAERDSDGNGHVDQWWEYKTPDCPIIRSDVDGNGEPDPTSRVDFCSEASYQPPEQADQKTAPMLHQETQALPTETSSKTVADPAASGADTAETTPSATGGATKAGPPANVKAAKKEGAQ